MALQNTTRPEKMFSVFAGQDREATDRAPEKLFHRAVALVAFNGAIFRDGQLAYYDAAA